MKTGLISNRLWVNPWNDRETIEEKLFFVLRLGVALCFIGHGAWGLIGKAGWLPFFDLFSIPENISWSLMPLIGIMDIAVGILALVRPTKGLLLWAAFWTLFTAALRPCAGMGMSEFFERAGNFGIPLAFLWITNSLSIQGNWARELKASSLDLHNKSVSFDWLLKLSIASLLMGHGGLALFQNHPVLTKHFAFFGFPSEGNEIFIFGIFEMALGLSVLIWSHSRALLFFVLIFKLATEAVHPIAGNPLDIFETIERGGDYVLPILLLIGITNEKHSSGQTISTGVQVV